jgi:hypothetical protein
MPMAWYDFLSIATRLAAMQAQLAALQTQMSAVASKQDAAAAFMEGKRKPKQLRIAFEQTQYLNKQGVLTMSGNANVTTDHDLRVPLMWEDDAGVVSAPTSGTTAVSDTPAVCTVDVAADDMSIVVRSVAAGSANVTVSNGTMTDTIAVTVAAPSASVLDIDAADATMIPKGTAA